MNARSLVSDLEDRDGTNTVACELALWRGNVEGKQTGRLRPGIRGDAHAERCLGPVGLAVVYDNLEAHATLLGEVLAATVLFESSTSREAGQAQSG